jgi:shikimate dehydrogenase
LRRELRLPVTPTAATRVAGVIGHPIAHSLSPPIHNAAFAACGLDWTYLAFDVPPGFGSDAVRAVRVLGLAGLSVTMPHKEAAASAVDRLSDDAAALAAVNTVVPAGDELVGDNTDGQGFLDSLPGPVGGGTAAVVGAGGSARAVVLALARAGAAQVAVVNRSQEHAVRAAALAGDRGVVVTGGDVADAVRSADLVVNATPLGMDRVAAGELPVDPDWLHPGQVVVDLVYRPLTTPLLAAAAQRGATAVDGLDMLVHQAARQFERWTGLEAPIEAMAAAARRAVTNDT